MSGPLTPEQAQALIDTYGTHWDTAELLLSDEGLDQAKAGQRGGSGGGVHHRTTSKGIVVFRLTRREGERWPVAVDEVLAVPWAAVRAHRKVAPAELAAVQVALDAWRAVSRDYPTPNPDLEVRRVGPSMDIHPEDRDLYARRREEYWRDVVGPWEVRERAARADLDAAIRTYLATAVPAQVDLLDMLTGGAG